MINRTGILLYKIITARTRLASITLFALIAGFGCASVLEHGPSESADNELSDVSCNLNDAEAALLHEHNITRASGRLCGSTSYPAVAKLRWNCTLKRAASNHSADMAGNIFIDHTGSDGSSPFDRIINLGYNYRAAGENIAAGPASVNEVMSGWLTSPGHCKNIMSANFTEVGAALIRNANGSFIRYWTVVFATPR